METNKKKENVVLKKDIRDQPNLAFYKKGKTSEAGKAITALHPDWQ